jgi:hypothetical protein
VFVLAIGANHHSAPAHIHAPTHRDAAFNRVAKRPSIHVINKREQLSDAVPDRVIAIRANEGLGG